jgi:hypothetical protein
VSAAPSELPELRRHLLQINDLLAHCKLLIMWRTPLSETALVLGVRPARRPPSTRHHSAGARATRQSVLLFAYYDMLLSGVALLAACYCVWSFLRERSGLASLDERRVFATESEKAEVVNRARRAVRGLPSARRSRDARRRAVRVQTRTLRKINEMIATARTWARVDSWAQLVTLSQWLLGAALVAAVVPLRWFLMLGGARRGREGAGAKARADGDDVTGE